MKSRPASLTGAILGALLGFICTARPVVAGSAAGRGETGPAETASDTLGPGIVPPPAGASLSPQQTNRRGGDDSTLEIAPQPALKPPGSITDAISAGYEPKPDKASVDRSSVPGAEEPGSGPRPYLGIAVGFPDQSHPETEGRGLEIVSVDPGSPAEQAGLEGRVGMTAVGTTAATAGALLGPLSSFAMPLLRKAGALGHPGDKIVAVDDRRVRTREDLEDALSTARPGQIVYFTVVRSLAEGQRKTLTVAVKLASAGQYATAAAPAPTRPPTH